MRILSGAIVLVLALSTQTTAQQTLDPSSFLTGVKPGNLQFKPINTGTAIKPLGLNSAFPAQRQQSAFGLGKVFPKISLGSWPPKLAQSPLLPQTSNVFQPSPPKGFNPFANAKKFITSPGTAK